MNNFDDMKNLNEIDYVPLYILCAMRLSCGNNLVTLICMN